MSSSRSPQPVGGSSSVRPMLIALLAAVMLAQLAAMAMIANSQVERAEKRAEVERNLVVAQRAAPASTRQGAAKQVVKVGYVLAE